MSRNPDPQVTNVNLLKSAQLGSYVGGDIGRLQMSLRQFSELRSKVGGNIRAHAFHVDECVFWCLWSNLESGRQRFRTDKHRQFLKLRFTTPNPANLYVTVDEHPDNINDGYFRPLEGTFR